MILLRSLLFNIALWTWSAAVVLVGLVVALGPQRLTNDLGRIWTRGILWLLRAIVGLDHEVRGTVPNGPVVVASKHQSAWETLAMPVLLRHPVYVLKRELFWFPLIGICFWRAGHIGVDRRAGAAAMRGLLRGARRMLAAGRPIVIFPEGTRTAPGSRRPYQPGVAALYGQLDAPVVPVALNSGHFWGRRSFLKRPGRIVVEFLEPIPPGLDRRRFMAELSERIESASDRLLAEAAR